MWSPILGAEAGLKSHPGRHSLPCHEDKSIALAVKVSEVILGTVRKMSQSDFKYDIAPGEGLVLPERGEGMFLVQSTGP